MCQHHEGLQSAPLLPSLMITRCQAPAPGEKGVMNTDTQCKANFVQKTPANRVSNGKTVL